MSAKLILAASVLALAAPLAAQQSTVPGSPTLPPNQPLPQDRGYDKTTPRTEAVNAAEAPVTAQLNSGVAATTTAQQTNAAVNQGQYAIDRKAYMDALIAHDAAVNRTDARWARQQMAYADAMAAWRAQVAACQAGHKAACDMPSPTPDQFY